MLCSRCKKRIAVIFVANMDGDQAKNEGLCLPCAQELGIKPVNDIVNQMGLTGADIENMSDELMEVIDEEGLDPESFELGGAQTFPFLQNLFGDGQSSQDAQAPKKERSSKEKSKGKQQKKKFLDQYCENLTQKARDGKLDIIIGRDKEIYRTIQILTRRSKNNPCLIGEPGVGKTAIAEGIAQRIAVGDVPSKLMDKEILLLDLTALVAGTQFRGQFESRIKSLVEEVKKDGNVILFIDEVHNLVSTGDAEGSMNAANILKPALSRGEIQVIGATTFAEYRKYIEKDAALERRFQPVTIEEPSVDDAVQILAGVKSYYEKHHNVTVPNDVLRHTVTFSERYITDRFLPDKAIDLLDEACASAALANKEADEYLKLQKQKQQLEAEEEQVNADVDHIDYEKIAQIKADLCKIDERTAKLPNAQRKTVVTDDDLANVIELWTGIPSSKIKETQMKKLSKLEEHLRAHIIGQDEAIEEVAAAIRRSRIQLDKRRRPASFIFVGATGVGKTELVKVLANELFDTPETLIRLDMSEFMEKHSVSRIIGAPPGYVGYDESGQLTEKVRRKPYSVVLFDEIEKAHPDVMNILLQILDEGKVTDAHGKTVSFQNCIIVMTSNAGSDRKEGAMGFAKRPDDLVKEKTMKALTEFLRPEFLSRVDEIIVFRTLTKEDFGKIARLMLSELQEALEDKGISLTCDGAAVDLLVGKAYGKKFGARDLRRVIRKEVEDRVASLMVERYDDAISHIQVTAEGETIKVLAL